MVPAFNEEGSIKDVLCSIFKHCANLNFEVVVINDGSKDKTRRIVEDLIRRHHNLRLLNHEVNKGKGRALQTGLENANGDIIVIQDADMEYNPKDIVSLVTPILNGVADVVYGSRFASGDIKTMKISHRIGNWGLTVITRILYGFKTTDMETGYKAFRKELLAGTVLKANSFNIEPELTAIFSRRKAVFVEVPIAYNYRRKGVAKISWIDGVIALWWLLKMKFQRI